MALLKLDKIKVNIIKGGLNVKKAIAALFAITLLTACGTTTGPGNKTPADDNNNNIEEQNYRGNDFDDRNIRNNNVRDNNLNRRQFNDNNDNNLGPDNNNMGPDGLGPDNNLNDDNMVR